MNVDAGVETAAAVSVVVPVYNSQETLEELVRRLHLALSSCASAHEIIFVDDDSRDESWDRLSAIAARDPLVRGLRHARNFGQHNALLTGVREARYELIATLDDDLQNPPEDLPALIARLTPEVDVVYGTRPQERHGLLRNVASRLTKIALRSAMGVAMATDVTAFRVFRTALRDAFTEFESPFVSIDVLLSWGTTRFAAIQVGHAPRLHGRSNYTFGRLVGHALNMLVGFSIQPLRFASWLGFLAIGFGFGVLAWVLGRYIYTGGASPAPGFPFLASTIAIFSGVQLFAIGVIGEYLARMHSRSTGRPCALVRERTPGQPERDSDSTTHPTR